MFKEASVTTLDRMHYLEERNKNEMSGEINIQQFDKLRQIPPETGKFISLIAANCPKGRWIEIGTSGGYSTLWLILACMNLQKKITTFEIDSKKTELANETFAQCNVKQYVELISGNVLDHLPHYKDISFCFLDADKEFYMDCYNIIVPHMVSGGMLLADNAISHQAALQPMINKALNDERLDSLVVPVGQGVLMCRRL